MVKMAQIKIVVLGWNLGLVLNPSLTKSQRSRAGIPSMRKPASREIISASVELCGSRSLFLAHRTYWHERVTPEYAQESVFGG